MDTNWVRIISFISPVQKSILFCYCRLFLFVKERFIFYYIHRGGKLDFLKRRVGDFDCLFLVRRCVKEMRGR